MGTSTSFRAPAIPRWQAFTVALQEGLSPARIRSELFNAGADWEQALSAPAVAAFAMALADAPTILSQRLVGDQRPERILRDYADEARQASAREGGTAALAIAERAFTALLTRVAADDVPLAGQSPGIVGEHLRSGLADPGETAIAYLCEVLNQYARHVLSREAGRLTEGEHGLGVSETRRSIRILASQAEEIGRKVEAPGGDSQAIRDHWEGLVQEAFRQGRELAPELR